VPAKNPMRSRGPQVFCEGPALYSPFVDRHRLLGPDLKTIRLIGGLGAGGKTTGRIGRVAELKIGPYSLSSPITLFSQDEAGAFAGSSLTGNIGAQIASKFRIFLDYGRSRIILEPNKTFNEPFDRAFSGLSLVAEGKDYRTFRVSEILENSPASEVGIQPNDIIASIDEVPAEQLTLSKLNEGTASKVGLFSPRSGRVKIAQHFECWGSWPTLLPARETEREPS